MTLGFSIVLTGGWPYLNKLDRQADKRFWSYVVAANPLGAMLFALLIGWWGNIRGSPTLPMIVTLSLFVISLSFYSLLDVSPIDNKKYYMIATRFFVGVSAANIAVARAYLSAATKTSERTHAVSMLALAQVIGFAIGQVIQSF
ncbi:major facilitator superfamily domain-containing protein 8-like [Aphidius gifuensis]|uniref:major facilitator superfamily domain-containing protein 8-like n=1 Tax=Aphidius gifuensis TaxID=684658 RepID=UPI001CDB6E2B|nr:major facilitator superfamily domain-containing protein 8-like [Aphidius gifuensis]